MNIDGILLMTGADRTDPANSEPTVADRHIRNLARTIVVRPPFATFSGSPGQPPAAACNCGRYAAHYGYAAAASDANRRLVYRSAAIHARHRAGAN
jgi:hypothetical protein